MSKLINAASLRGKDWGLWRNDDGTMALEQIQLLLLWEIREELRTLNRLLECPNFTGIPQTLRDIRRVLNRRRRKAKK